jgi:phosphoglycolate phosphatase-like HAD superfamily hydrolase
LAPNIQKLIIFDVDNTLILYQDDVSFFDKLLVEALNKQGIPLPPKEERLNLWGKGREYPRILESWGINEITKFWQVFDAIDIRSRSEMAKSGEISANPQSIPLLKLLIELNHKCAVLSNSNQPLTDFFMEYFGFKPYLVRIQGLTPEKDPFDCKPEINGLNRLISHLNLNIKRDDIILVGDSFGDILAAKRAGIKAILFDPTNLKENKYPQDLVESDYIRVQNLSQIYYILTGHSPFGYWDEDEAGLPVYKYICNQYDMPWARYFTTYGESINHYHQFGNTRWMATAHNDGHIQLMDSGQGFLWLNFKGESNDPSLDAGIAIIEKDGEVWSDRYENQPSLLFGHQIIEQEREFGTHYFRKITSTDEIKVVNLLTMPDNDKCQIFNQIKIKNLTDHEISFNLFSYWGLKLYYLKRSALVMWNNRKHFGTNHSTDRLGNFLKYMQKVLRIDTDTARERWAKKVKYNFEFNKEKFTIISHISHPSCNTKKLKVRASIPPMLKDFYISALNAAPYYYEFDQKHGLKLGYKVILSPNESREVLFLIGYAENEKIQTEIQEITKEGSNHFSFDEFEHFNKHNYKSHYISYSVKDLNWLKQESLWHSAYVHGSIFQDDLLNLHKLPQGSIYAYGHGLDGSIRDFALYLPSMILLNPTHAREFLTYILSLMRPDGSLLYGTYGFGKAIPFVHSHASDLYLFLLWAVSEYIYSTRDFEFLSIKIPYFVDNKNGINKSPNGTVLQRIEKAITFLFSKNVGFGPNDMLKINDGDWSDGVTMLVKDRKKFVKEGESSFNTSFALYIFPRIQPLLDKYLPDLSNVVSQAFSKLQKAMERSWNGKWFYRGYCGKDSQLGDLNMFLEHIPWYLISRNGDKSKINTLIQSVESNLDKSSKIGPLIVYPPSDSANDLFHPGWDVNGGVWHAINNLLTWGYVWYDSKRAIDSIIKNSMHTRESIYPHIWYGIWTGPDSYNAHYADRPGEAFFHLATPMCDYPAQNMNLHSCFLMSCFKTTGFEADHEGYCFNLDTKHEFEFLSPFIRIIRTIEELVITLNKKYILNTTFKFKLFGKECNVWHIAKINPLNITYIETKQLFGKTCAIYDIDTTEKNAILSICFKKDH